ncbi:MAG: hypothetical protein H0S78_02285 [Tissierellales bacterium]|jgi:hypothetical protein|nr:hypothetical protein [Tissierellales bacterium]
MKEFKYEPLKEFFSKIDKDKIKLTYKEIEEIINDKLPEYAYKYSTFWSNGGQYQDYAWLDARWRVKKVVLSDYIIFEKIDNEKNYEQLSFIEGIGNEKVSKYIPLEEYLKEKNEPHIKLTYKEIEEIINDKLPESAYKYKGWWSNSEHNRGEIWLNTKYKVVNIELGSNIEFEKYNLEESFIKKIIHKIKNILFSKK